MQALLEVTAPSRQLQEVPVKVDRSTNNPVQGSETQSAKGARKTGSAKETDHATGSSESRGASGAVKAEVSDRAREMATARAAASDAPDVREEKIAELKARIAAGKYKVDPAAVADRLVDDHVRMSGIS
jgi:flagellar biosynthesis anti-sigma factor FlgM